MKKLNIIALLFVPMFAFICLAGCTKDKSIKNVNELYSKIITSNANEFDIDNNKQPTKAVAFIKYDNEAFKINSYNPNYNKDLMLSYVQLNTLYSTLLTVPSLYFDKYLRYINNSEPSFDIGKSDINALYNKLSNIKNRVIDLEQTKNNIQSKAQISNYTNTNIIPSIQGYNYDYSKLINEYFELAIKLSNIIEESSTNTIDVLDGTDDIAKNDYISRLGDRAVLQYAYVVFYENVQAFCTYNNCDTLPLVEVKTVTNEDDVTVAIEPTKINMLPQLQELVVNGTNPYESTFVTFDATKISEIKTLYSTLMRYEKLFEVYKKAIDSIDYHSYTMARVADNNDIDSSSVASYKQSLSIKELANLNIAESFVGQETSIFSNALNSCIA